jgi:choline dehydrogenase-like flavoprotein
MDHDVRSSSAHSYLYPLEHARNNWLTLVNHQAEVLLWSDDDDEKRVTGVQFQTTSDGFYGLRHRVHARKEVILAAGAINTPALLQRSGVGNPHHLESLGIPIKIDLPTVGKNLQEQTSNSLGATGSGYNKGGEGPSDVIAYPNIYELFGSEAVDVVEAIKQNISAWAEQQAENALNKEALLKIYKHQANMIIHREGTYPSYPQGSTCCFFIIID